MSELHYEMNFPLTVWVCSSYSPQQTKDIVHARYPKHKGWSFNKKAPTPQCLDRGPKFTHYCFVRKP